MFFIEVYAQVVEGRHVDLFDVAEMRSATGRVLHALSDLAAHADHRDLLFVVAFGIRVGARRGPRGALLQIGLEVVMQNAPGRARALDQT